MKTSMLNIIKILIPTIILIPLSSCTLTPQSRINKYPEKYENQSPHHQELIDQGKITQGMNKDAVYLAFGKPSRTLTSGKDGQQIEIWRYYQNHDLDSNIHWGGNIIIGTHHRDWDIFPSIILSPNPHNYYEKEAEVKFQNGIVIEWEKINY